MAPSLSLRRWRNFSQALSVYTLIGKMQIKWLDLWIRQVMRNKQQWGCDLCRESWLGVWAPGLIQHLCLLPWEIRDNPCLSHAMSAILSLVQSTPAAQPPHLFLWWPRQGPLGLFRSCSLSLDSCCSHLRSPLLLGIFMAHLLVSFRGLGSRDDVIREVLSHSSNTACSFLFSSPASYFCRVLTTICLCPMLLT